MNDGNIAQVQQRMPNRNGMTIDHGLWNARGARREGHAMHGALHEFRGNFVLLAGLRTQCADLAEQNRIFGPYRGSDTTAPRLTALPGAGYGATSVMVATPNSA